MRPYGWNADGTIAIDEATVLRAAAADVIDGRPVNQIVADLNARGITTSSGGTWGIGPLTRMLRNPRLTGRRKDRTGTLVPLQDVDPILDIEQHEQVLEVLDDPARKKSAPKSRSSTLTGLLQCSRCGAPMTRRAHRWRCAVCASSISAPTVEAEVAARVLARLSTPVWQEALAGAVTAGAGKYRQEVEAAHSRMVTLAETFGRGAAEQEALEAGVAAARRRVEAAEFGLALATSAAVLDGLSDEELVQWWAQASEAARREVVALVIERVDVLPADQARGEDRILCRWR